MPYIDRRRVEIAEIKIAKNATEYPQPRYELDEESSPREVRELSSCKFFAVDYERFLKYYEVCK
jgi:ssDNA-binding replication factor A large subunit